MNGTRSKRTGQSCLELVVGESKDDLFKRQLLESDDQLRRLGWKQALPKGFGLRQTVEFQNEKNSEIARCVSP